MTGVGGGGHGGGHKAVLAISEDNESAVIKYRSEQDMASICEYQMGIHVKIQKKKHRFELANHFASSK